MNSKIIVTGGCGYIGSHTVIELIESNFDVVILDDLSNSTEKTLERIQKITGVTPEFVKIDLKDPSATQKVFKTHKDADGVIHFAAHKAVGESVEQPIKYYKNNFYSLLNTLEAQSENGINNFIFSSSATVYGTPDLLPITEKNETQRPFSPYGNTKKIAEEILDDFTKSNSEFSAISSRQFIKDSYIFRDGITENVPVGNIYTFTYGKHYKNNEQRFYLGAKIAHGNYYKWGYLSTSFEYGTFLKNSKSNQTAYSFSANYFTNLIELGNTWKLRQFVKPQFIIGKDRLNSVGDRVTIDETNDYQSFYGNELQRRSSIGIPGFDSGLLGTSKYVLALQTQFYPPWSILGFRFNPYINITAAMLGDEKSLVTNGKVYSSFGIGVVIRNDYLVFNSFQLSLNFYPDIPGEGRNVFSTNTLNSEDFGLQGFQVDKPSPIWYN